MRRWAGRTAFVVAALGVAFGGVSGCGSAPGAGTSGATGAAASTPSVDPLVHARRAVLDSFPEPAPVTLLATRPSSDAVSMPWAFVRQDGSTVTILYVAGEEGCEDWTGVTVTETDRAVTVGIWATPRRVTACGGGLREGATTLRLRRPLAPRVLVHEPVSSDFRANFFAP
ncbi:MAG TPA: hypothetical protein VFL99_03100 [Segeticoccus sp.]|uniref:hypothetical protein n=1 Tax=Segeticoccus sp. TaxID=2706531 RepID=UPI002D7F350C|nr:hypothetical protein [Segeticoccus sp.]HET8599287.1 hypothetical protein [Segeticoccus sp.]